jgi:hypothetical protein
MTYHISIDVPYSNAEVDSQDEARAIAAAEAYFAEHRIDAMDCQTEYRCQRAFLDGEDGMDGLAAHFVAAQNAASKALTSTWDVKGQAVCSIEVWEV